MQVFFKKWRHLNPATRPKPVMVHVNYHPDKGERMKGIIEYFATGDVDAIMTWPGGSETGS
jgi:arabinosyltransferase